MWLVPRRVAGALLPAPQPPTLKQRQLLTDNLLCFVFSLRGFAVLQLPFFSRICVGSVRTHPREVCVQPSAACEQKQSDDMRLLRGYFERAWANSAGGAAPDGRLTLARYLCVPSMQQLSTFSTHVAIIIKRHLILFRILCTIKDDICIDNRELRQFPRGYQMWLKCGSATHVVYP